jgi:hypothetical protein
VEIRMKKKIVIFGPVLSVSGYGYQARFALESLRRKEDIFDIYVINTLWGANGWIPEQTEERQYIDSLILKTNKYLSQPNQGFDISLQITIPTEFKKMCPLNIGYTAAMETDKVAPEWIVNCNEMDKIIVPSEHSKKTLTDCSYVGINNQTGQQVDVRLNVPVEVVSFPFKNVDGCEEVKELEDIKTPFNFLTVSQWGPRKNIENTIVWFLQEFQNNPDVGLVLKVHGANPAIPDRYNVLENIQRIKKHACPNSKAKIYLLHGYMTEGQLKTVYSSEKIKAIVQISHGEGFCGLDYTPIITKKGTKRLDSMLVGDEVLTHKGRFKKVSKLLRRNYTGEMYKITPYNTQNVEPIILTPNHNVYVYNKKDDNFVWKKTEDLTKKDILCIPRPSFLII